VSNGYDMINGKKSRMVFCNAVYNSYLCNLENRGIRHKNLVFECSGIALEVVLSG